MRTRSILYGGVLLAAACTDSPVETERASDDTIDAAAAVSASTCTKTWASGIGGLRADPSRWAPAGAPGPKDDVCIAAPGKYDILATQSIDVRSLVIGGDGAVVTFDFDPPLTGIGINADVILGILPGSELNILSKGLVPLSGGILLNFGTVDLDNVCACGGDVAILTFDRIDNLERMELDAPTSIQAPVWTNGSRGAIVTRGQGVITVQDGGQVSNWGQIVGSTRILVDNFLWAQHADGRRRAHCDARAG